MQEALKLVLKVFLEYEAPNYTEEGIREFKKTINNSDGFKQEIFMALLMKIIKYWVLLQLRILLI